MIPDPVNNNSPETFQSGEKVSYFNIIIKTDNNHINKIPEGDNNAYNIETSERSSQASHDTFRPRNARFQKSPGS
jgi:hypothetical protein